MSMLLLQTFLLMLTAFFLGAVVACLVKSTFFDVAVERSAEAIPVPAPIAQPRPAAVIPQPPPRPAPEAVRPKIETVTRPATAPSMPIPDAQRFERALREQTPASAPSAAVSPAQPTAPPRPAAIPPAALAAAAPKPPEPAQAAPRIEVKPPMPLEPKKPDVAAPAAVQPATPLSAAKSDAGIAAAVAAAAAMATAQARPAPAGSAPAANPPAAAPQKPIASPPASPIARPPTPTAPQPIMPVAAGSSGPAAVSAPVQPPVAPVVAPADDLTRIRAIDANMQTRLNALGVRRYDDLARWTTDDVMKLRAVPGIGSRIAVENWIEQAQILAKGGTTEYARRRAAQGQTMATAMPSQNTGVASPVRAQPPSAAPAAPMAAPKPLPPVAPAVPVAVSPLPPAAPTQSAAPAPPATFELPRSGAQAAAAAAAAIAAAAAASARRSETSAGSSATSAPSSASGRDDLQRIHGINADAEKLLNAQGITRYAQVAGWSAADTERLNGLLGTPGRIARENWIEQAAVLASGAAGTYTRRADLPPRAPETESSRPARLSDALREREAVAKTAEPERSPATAARTDFSNLRSVRSEALRGDVAGAGASADDLKRIRGIGVLIEKKLNSLGVSSYEQVANWTGADIDRISQILDFKGRIERENWVEQARILASGGQTEFSRRVDKGDA